MCGQGNINYGVIDYQLPSNARVAVIGDWGTGLDDAISLLANIVSQYKPTAIIHLGDTYYSGTPDETTNNPVALRLYSGFSGKVNHSYYHQWISLYWSRVYGNVYLTTTNQFSYYWQMLSPALNAG